MVYGGAVPLAVAEREIAWFVARWEVHICHREEVRSKVVVIVVLEAYIRIVSTICGTLGSLEKGILRSAPNGSGINSLEFGADGDGG